MTEKRDWLGECNNHKVPVEDFELAFCQRCMAPDCSRSNSGKSLFEQRISTWHDRLFAHPARMSEDDPRLVQIRAKKFVELPAGPVPEVGRVASNAWLDPRDLDEPLPATSPVSASATIQPSVTEPVTATTSVPAAPEGLRLLNTPRPAAAQMIGGKAPPTPAPVVDKWAAKPAETESDKVKPGARIRFGAT